MRSDIDKVIVAIGQQKMTGACLTKTIYRKTLRNKQDGHLLNDIFKCIFKNDNVWSLIMISLKFVPMGPINNITTLAQKMAWLRPGDQPLSEPMMVWLQWVDIKQIHWITA